MTCSVEEESSESLVSENARRVQQMDGLDTKNTKAFYTFDPIDSDLFHLLLPALDEAASGDDSNLISTLTGDDGILELLQSQGIDSVDSRSSIPWDDATLLWLLCSTPGGTRLESLDKGKARERLGRFPSHDGSPLSYLLDNLVVDENSNLLDLISTLNMGLAESILGHGRYSTGFGGLQLSGYLDREQISRMRDALRNDQWGVSSDEPHDGGVREIVKHLVVILRAAASRRVGIIMRRHE